MSKTVYEPHPVSPERKAELRAQGLRILDARFDPEPVPDAGPITRETIAGMKKADLADLLTGHGVDVPEGAKVADLRDLASEVVFIDG